MPDVVIAYLGLGSSLGDREANMREALRRLERDGTAVRVTAVSPVYQSPHLGLQPDDARKYPPHLNIAARIETALLPEELLERIRAVEEAGGRQRNEKWGPRTIDVDILLYGDETMESPSLTIPHPGLAERAFVVLPLSDLDPNLCLPDGRSLTDLRESVTIREQRITRLEEAEPLL